MTEPEPVIPPELERAARDLGWLYVNGALAGVAAVMAERRRQIGKLGWTPEHGDGQGDGGLANIAYRCLGEVFENRESGQGDPGDEERLLRNAGALAAAEIDRVIRAREKGRRT